MTHAEADAKMRRLDEIVNEIMEMDRPVLCQFLELLSWQDKDYLQALDYLIAHLRNLVCMYGYLFAELRGKTQDPQLRRLVDFGLAFDDLGRPKLDAETEERLRDLRQRAWRGLLGQREDLEGNRDN